MRQLILRGPGVLALALGLALLLPYEAWAENKQPAGPSLIRIGMISTLFRDTPENVVLTLMQPLGAMMKTQTGVSGQLVPGGDAQSLGRQLASDKVHLGVFHGIEFAWARAQHPELKPLVIAVNHYPQLYAFLVVRQDSPIKCLNDLRGKVLALPRFTKEHCYVYVDYQCRRCGCNADKFFRAIKHPASIEEALDDVVDKLVDATVVDVLGLECYERRKPGRFAKLKTVHRSEAFPAAVVSYRPGLIDEATLEKFREGLISAKNSVLGRQLLNLWKLTGFEPVPPNYEANLEAIVKAYPPSPGAR